MNNRPLILLVRNQIILMRASSFFLLKKLKKNEVPRFFSHSLLPTYDWESFYCLDVTKRKEKEDAARRISPNTSRQVHSQSPSLSFLFFVSQKIVDRTSGFAPYIYAQKRNRTSLRPSEIVMLLIHQDINLSLSIGNTQHRT